MLIDMIDQYDEEKKAYFLDIWNKILKQIAIVHDQKKIVSFLSKVWIISIDEKDKFVYIWVPNEFVLTQVKKFFAKPVDEAIKSIYNEHFQAKFVVYSWFQTSWNGNWLLSDMKKTLNIKSEKKEEAKIINSSIKSELSQYFGILFDPTFRFDNFISWANTNFAYSAAKATAENPWSVYNPLFIYGNVWLWKTHLMQAIWNEIMTWDSKKVVLYLPTSKLIDEIINAIKTNKLQNLIKKFEDVDVLLIDDIQFLADKDKTQEIFHNIFNDFHIRKKQIIISSDRPPKELINIVSRLKSRFALWLVVDIQAPDYETRIAILQSKLEKKDENIDFELLSIIAKYVKDNVRELEWALNILLTRKAMWWGRLTEDDVYSCLKTLWYKTENNANHQTQDTQQQNLRWSQNFGNIVEMVASYYTISVNEIKSDIRKKEITVTRQILMLLAKKYFWRTLQKIWDYFGWKNHTSVIYAIDNIEKKLHTDENIRHDWNIFVEWVEKW